jgi:AraC-like DNA-binding protein
MYNPVQDGIEKTVTSVKYTEAKPPKTLSSFVHCFWELKTDGKLNNDFKLHALPDACTNILFNQINTDIAGVTALRTKFEVLNLGKEFNYVGIQFLPGVWQGDKNEISDKYIGTAYKGKLPLIKVSKEIAKLEFVDKQTILSNFVRGLIEGSLVVNNFVTEKILTSLEKINTVSDMASITELSARQLQRILKQTTGFSPHNLLKILRLQQSFKKHYTKSYADQSHFIHSFKKITGYTPKKYTKKYNV